MLGAGVQEVASLSLLIAEPDRLRDRHRLEVWHAGDRQQLHLVRDGSVTRDVWLPGGGRGKEIFTM